MAFDPTRHCRRSIRLRDYDYTRAGAYFITICSRDRSCIFADVRDGDVRLTPVGEVIGRCWEAILEHFPAVELDAFVIMPNHVHGIIVLGSDENNRGAEVGTACRAPTGERATAPGRVEGRSSVEQFGHPVAGSVPTIIRSFKGAVTRAINDDSGRDTACRVLLAQRLGPMPPEHIPSVWQSNYHEHVIRNERSLERLRVYVAANPVRWEDDSLHPDHPDGARLVAADFIQPRRPENWDDFFAARESADVPPNFLDKDERDQGVHDCDPFEGWVE